MRFTYTFIPRNMDARHLCKLARKCGCLARMAPVADTCVYAEGLELTNTEWRSMLGCLMIPNRGFRVPFLHRLTTADLQESWVCFPPHNFWHNLGCKSTSECTFPSICSVVSTNTNIICIVVQICRLLRLNSCTYLSSVPHQVSTLVGSEPQHTNKK